jgi:pyruvate kinase
MEYEIIATLGPGSDNAAVWQAMLAAGATAFRLNTSHLSLGQLTTWLEKLDPFTSTREQRPPIILDLQGSKWRLGQFEPFDLHEGQSVELIYAMESSQRNVLPVPHADFFRAAAVSNGEIVLNDAKTRLEVETSRSGSLRARVTQGGVISPNKGITFTASTYRSEALSDKDQTIIRQTRDLPSIRYAISYVRDAAEMAGYRARINRMPGHPAYLIAKLERQPAVDEAALMAEAANGGPSADELWICRGDLGAELGLKDMAKAVQRFSEKAGRFPAPAILAGQVLEHMTGQPNPTRSEICYLYDALSKGYRGVVLSDETAIGRYPVESCKTAALFRKSEL